ncbi:MFS transporter [Pseudomonas monteilii]|uniref:MFS transporter n=1 Tax=Pseudomonas monteilii TaxID=76759 RepID=A0A399MDW9_9PSED|nr:MFS transporter [Pseudomonas monteilii]RII79665.1 MFS transporter [Pseudomonas monteilii]
MNASIFYLSLSALISSAGTTLFVSALALSLFNMDSSAVKATSVYIAQFLPVIFLLPLAVKICDSYAVRRGLVTVEIVSALITVFMGLCVQADWLIPLYLVLAVRGFLELITKTFRSVGVKSFADPVGLDKANNLVMGGSFVGQALGALAGFLLVSRIPLLYIAIIDGVTYLLSALCCIKIASSDVRRQSRSSGFNSSWAGLAEIRENNNLRLYFMYFSLVLIIFQSYNQVARTWIPLAWLNLGLGKGIIGEMIGCMGIVVGLLIVSFFLSSPKNVKGLAFLSIFLTCLFVSTPFVTLSPVLSLALYFVYMVLFEIGLMVSMNGLLAVCPQHRVASVMGLFYGFSFGGVTISGLSMAFAADYYRLPAVSVVLSVVAVVVLFGISYFPICSNSKAETVGSELKR